MLAHAEAPAGRAGVHAEVYAGVTPTEGVAPVRTYPCGKAQPPALARDLRAPTRCTMLDRLICVFIVIGGVTGLCAVTWPGSFPAGDPGAVLHSERVHGCGRLVLRRTGRGRVSRRPASHQHRPDLVRQDGRRGGAPRPPSALATFAHGRRPGHRHRRGPPPRQTGGECHPGLAHDPGAGPLYRRGASSAGCRGTPSVDVGSSPPLSEFDVAIVSCAAPGIEPGQVEVSVSFHAAAAAAESRYTSSRWQACSTERRLSRTSAKSTAE